MLKPKLTKAEFAKWCDEHAEHHKRVAELWGRANRMDEDQIHRLRERLDEDQIHRLRERLDKLEQSLVGDAQRWNMGLQWIAGIFAWLNRAPYLSPKLPGEDYSVEDEIFADLGITIPDNCRMLQWGDMHRHIADYLASRGIAPQEGEYKHGVRQKPFPGADSPEGGT